MSPTVLVNKKTVRSIKALKLAQKEAKKYYKLRGAKKELNAKINKLVPVNTISFYPYQNIDTCSYDFSKLTTTTRDELISVCERCSITGRSGNDFQISQKLTSIKENFTLIINGVECEPGLIHDAWLYRNRFKDIEYSVQLLNSIFSFKEIILATKEKLTESTHFTQIQVPNQFPMGYENFLIKHCLNVDIKEGQLPMEQNVIVMNLQSVIALGEIINDETLANSRYITIADFTNGTGFVTRVPIAESISSICDKFNLKADGEKKLYTGGGALYAHPLMENETTNASTSIIALAKQIDYSAASSCVGCGRCVKNCPKGVNVRALVKQLDKNIPISTEMKDAYNLNSCIGCAACTYNCAAGKDTRLLVMTNGVLANDK